MLSDIPGKKQIILHGNYLKGESLLKAKHKMETKLCFVPSVSFRPNRIKGKY